MRRLTFLLGAASLLFWVLAVPLPHGHPPGSPAHDHGTEAAVPSNVADVVVAEAAAEPPLSDEAADLPLATGLTIVVLAVAVVAAGVVVPTPVDAASPGREPLDRSPPSPITRHEVIVV